MNINLKKLGGTKKSLQLGLNAPTASSAFQRDNESSSDDNDTATGRDAVNRSIAKEQAALRARAEASARDTLSGSTTADLYDYDGAYDSFPTNRNANDGSRGAEPKNSRYMGDLLKAADQRKHERDIAYERKIARDQAAEEDADPDVRGKETFVTAAYKQKLQERHLWQAKDAQQQQVEEANDVTKRSDGMGMASFYGNLTKNVAMGGEQHTETQSKDDKRTKRQRSNDNDETSRGKHVETKQFEPTERHASQSDVADSNARENPEERRQRIRLERETKVQQARVRYFERRATAEQKGIEA